MVKKVPKAELWGTVGIISFRWEGLVLERVLSKKVLERVP